MVEDFWWIITILFLKISMHSSNLWPLLLTLSSISWNASLGVDLITRHDASHIRALPEGVLARQDIEIASSAFLLAKPQVIRHVCRGIDIYLYLYIYK